jgi:alpha-glucosidase (family GH31 glycosyl hydrolase)
MKVDWINDRCCSMKRKVIVISVACIFNVLLVWGQMGDLTGYEKQGKGYLFGTKSGERVLVRPYGDYMLRLQYAKPGQGFFPDNHYDIIINHDMGGSLLLKEGAKTIILETLAKDGIKVIIHKEPLRFAFYSKSTGEALLQDAKGMLWEGTFLKNDFKADKEHILGFGQKPLGYQESINLNGQRTRRNYNEYGIPGRGAQGNLLVPFYMSSKGYGLYMNSMFPNEFAFNESGEYSIGFETEGFEGQMDYVFIIGPGFDTMLDRYTQLTGRPKMPPKSIFGLQLSDNDPWINNKPIDQQWWETMVSRHRSAGLPLDHLVFDNDWRKGAGPNGEGVGQWSGSKFEFDPQRYPDPSSFKDFLEQNGLTLTLDLNLNNCNDSWGWLPKYNLPVKAGCDTAFSNSYPDYTNLETRNWIWELFWNKALDPALGYPGDGLWIDEPDGVNPSCVPFGHITANGRCWGEMKNYYYFLMAQAIVAGGWTNEAGVRTNYIGESKRPYVWIRGGTAGGQRYATHWTGDIHFTPYAYKSQIIALQASGLSGYPFFNHDAGGFVEKEPGPNDSVYIQWGMAFGSFTPIWRPHGYGQPRWPLNRSVDSQKSALKYGKLRYEMMPYIYTMAHLANQTGMPMARSMSLVYPEYEEAWENELQYMWGSEMLVAPALNLKGQDSIQQVWLPPGNSWYYFWNDDKHQGGSILQFNARYGELPVFVKSGAIVPQRPYAQSTFFLTDSVLVLDVYAGHDGSFDLWEDDGVSERFITRNEIRKTHIVYNEKDSKITVFSAEGTYNGASEKRQYIIRLHGIEKPGEILINNENVGLFDGAPNNGQAQFAIYENKILKVFTKNLNVGNHTTIHVK